MRQARIAAAERTGVVVDLREAEQARLEILNDALDPLFAEIPTDIMLFDRGISKGEISRLWIDALAYVLMGRDKRTFRFVQDTRYGRKVLAESTEVPIIADAVTKYVADRLVERERALADNGQPGYELGDARRGWRARSWRTFGAFVLGVGVGVAGLALLMLALG